MKSMRPMHSGLVLVITASLDWVPVNHSSILLPFSFKVGFAFHFLDSTILNWLSVNYLLRHLLIFYQILFHFGQRYRWYWPGLTINLKKLKNIFIKLII